jgi:parallel beta-helix repeat protein
VRNCLTNSNGTAGTAGIAFNSCNQIEILSCASMANADNSGIDLLGVTDGLIRSNKCISNGQRGIRVRSNSTRLNIIDNVCVDNTQQGIELNTATNCYVFENIASLNGAQNIDEMVGGPNTILSNWALAAVAGDNYGATTSTINSVTVDQSGTFPSEPTKWQNISMTT